MSLALLVALQAAAPGPTDPALEAFDLRNLGAPKGFESSLRPDACGEDVADEIVVCGSRNRNERHRLRPLPPSYETKPPIAETGLFGDVSARMHVESVQFPNGMVSKRLMVTFTAPF